MGVDGGVETWVFIYTLRSTQSDTTCHSRPIDNHVRFYDMGYSRGQGVMYKIGVDNGVEREGVISNPCGVGRACGRIASLGANH